MKKYAYILPIVICGFLLTACHASGADIPVAETTAATVYAEATAESVLETVLPPETEVTQPQITEPQHSEFYIPGVSVEEVILYFNEVCLDAEIVNNGDPSLLQKWTDPIEYALNGNFTSEDLSVFNDFLDWLNTVVGFPGIQEAQWPEDANLRINFCGEKEMISYMGNAFRGHDGAVTFWYNNTNEIYDGMICCRTDIDQFTRNSVILEELYNALGPIQDTNLRPDSIIYMEFSQPQNLTEMDELILRLLYHPYMKCGMDAASCETVIRQLYY